MPPTPSERVKATQLRNKVKGGAPLSPEEAVWLDDYERGREGVRAEQAKGASRSRKVETIHREEESAAVGTGSAAEVAAAAALSREEGRRYDHMLAGITRGFEVLGGLYEKLARVLLDRAVEDGRVIRELLRDHRAGEIERAEMEADAIRADAEQQNDPITKMAGEMLPDLIRAHIVGKRPPERAPNRPQPPDK